MIGAAVATVQAGPALLEGLATTASEAAESNRLAFAEGTPKSSVTGAATASGLTGFLRNQVLRHGRSVEVPQGAKMSTRSKLSVSAPDETGAPVLVSGSTGTIEQENRQSAPNRFGRGKSTWHPLHPFLQPS